MVRTVAGVERCEAVIAALPAPQAGDLIRGFDDRLAARLASVPYGSAATVSLAFREEEVSHPLNGFGFVVPAREGLSLLACTFAHRKYPGRAPAGGSQRKYSRRTGAGL